MKVVDDTQKQTVNNRESITSRFYRKNAATVRFQGAQGVKSSDFWSKRAHKGLKWGPQKAINSSLLQPFYSQSCSFGEKLAQIV